MKAGFNFPRCRYPGNDFRLGPENTQGPAEKCPLGKWKAAAEYAAAPKRFENKAALAAQIAERNAQVTQVHERSKICDACDGILASGKMCALKTCASCRRNNLLARPNMVCPADPPKWGPMKAEKTEPPPSDRLRVVWTISAWNESLLADTVRELYDSIIDPHIAFDVVVVDDGSTDNSAKNLDPRCHVIRNETSLGIGRNLNTAADYAIDELGADVIGVADSHMRIPKGAVGTLARRALEGPCVLCSSSRGYEDTSKTYAFGAYLCYKREDCIAAKWIGDKWPKQPDGYRRPIDEWAQVQVPLGAFYAYSADTVRKLKAPTGRLWETVVGRWGFLLEPFSLKCMLMGVPVYVSRDVFARHLYRSRNPIPRAHIEKVYNGAFGFASVLSEETFETYSNEFFRGFRKWCITRGNIDKRTAEKHIRDGRHGVVRPWTPELEREILDSLPRLDAKDGKHEAKPVPVEALWLPNKKIAAAAK